jgi:thiamine biosynthesis lipoprotein
MLSAIRNLAQRTFGRKPASGGWYRREEAIMGTAIQIELWADEREVAVRAIDAVLREMHRIDAAMSPFKPESELSRINREAAERAVALSEEMFDLLERSLEFSLLSDGAFDITFAGAGNLYDYRRGIKPTAAQLAAARAAIGYRHLSLDPQARTVRFDRPGMQIDLGGFAKGYAVDNAAAILAQHSIANAIVSAGGDSRIVGDRRGRPWSIGVRDPRRPGEVVAVLPLENVAVSTSGDYERFFDDDEGRCHHVIDPKTGRSPTGIRSVTVIADDGLTTEALAKSIFVMGVERGLQLIASRSGVDAVVIDSTGTLHHSAGLLDDVRRRRH